MNMHKNATNLLELSKEEGHNWLDSFDTVLVDCDGTLWLGYTEISGAVQTINALKSLNKRIYFITNNGTKTRHQLWKCAVSMGFPIAETDIISPSYSIAEYLNDQQFKQKVYVIGTDSIVEELSSFGIDSFGVGPDYIDGKLSDYIEHKVKAQPGGPVGAVIVSFDEHFTYGKMMKACNYLTTSPDCIFLTTNIDAVQKFPQYHIPGTGAILRSVESCVFREAIQLGKPNPLVCEKLLRSGDIKPERTLMIGDCCQIDVQFGKNCGFQTLLVGTGNSSWDDIQKMLTNSEKYHKFTPDVYLPRLSDLMTIMA